jgi:glycosyltransferase involved in cell wall biosynthesis
MMSHPLEGLDNPLVSIVIPSYQAEKYISATIESVLRQSYGHFELIIVDDGCTDQTLDIVNQYSDPRIRVISQENKGLSAARNSGISAAKGEYIAFLDADDIWFPNKLEADINTVNRYQDPVCIVFSGHYCVDDNFTLLNIPKCQTQPDTTYNTLLRNGTVLPSSLCIHKKILAEVGGFPVSNKAFFEDRAFYIRLCDKFPSYPTGQRLVLYRQSMEGLALKPLLNYETALQVEQKTVEFYKTYTAPEQFKELQDFHTRSLLNRFLKCNLFDSAKRYSKSVPVVLLTEDVKGLLTILSLVLDINLLYYCHSLLQLLLQYILSPWWHFECAKAFKNISTPKVILNTELAYAIGLK